MSINTVPAQIPTKSTLFFSGRDPHLGGGGAWFPGERGLRLLHQDLSARLLAQGNISSRKIIILKGIVSRDFWP